MAEYQSTDYQTKSWWLESLPQTITPNPPLIGKDKADVVVIGGGYTGLSVGYHLRQLTAAGYGRAGD